MTDLRPTDELCIGLMSGTSLDGVDAALCAFSPDGDWQGVLAHTWQPFDPGLREQLWALQSPGDNELHRAALAGNALAGAYQTAVDALRPAFPAGRRVLALGAHGQTVRHQPGLYDGVGYTLQLLQPALLARRTGIDVVADFRSADVAAGGQGAPLVPPFHARLFERVSTTVVVLNLGGIGNLTVLEPGRPPRGFDSGPGNALLDHWIHRHQGLAFDRDGAWAAGGQVDQGLLTRWLDEPYLQLAPPKSTGRDLFNPAWLARSEDRWSRLDPRDVQATLAEFTARSVADAIRHHAATAQELLVCGGGAFNIDLMARLAAALPALPIRSTDEAGLPAMQVEAAAFAWLAHQFIHRRPAGEPAVTGAAAARILGALYPA